MLQKCAWPIHYSLECSVAVMPSFIFCSSLSSMVAMFIPNFCTFANFPQVDAMEHYEEFF